MKSPVSLLTVLGLLLWTAITASTIYLPSGGVRLGSNPLQNFSRWWACLYGFCPSNSTSTKTSGSHTPLPAASSWFLPSVIILLSSLANGMWLLLAHTVLGAHHRTEIDDSLYIMAVLVFFPPILPAAVLFKDQFRSRPTDQGRMLEA